MLNEFLVLGQIPGTHHQLSIYELGIIVLLAIEVLLLTKTKNRFFNPSRMLHLKRYNRFTVQLQLFK